LFYTENIEKTVLDIQAKMNNKNKFKLLVFITMMALHGCVTDKPGVIYVDTNSTIKNDGFTWKTAYNNLQDAIGKANKDDEIWVAAGIYKPTKQFGGEGDRYKSFRLKENVAFYGGFEGAETKREERNWHVNKTILSGDLNGDDNNFENYMENSFHVVTGDELDSTAILDGFYITAGNANDSIWPNDGGGGMTNFNGSPTITNCTFIGNAAFADGGGMRNWGNSKPLINNCTFQNNRVVQEGGGLMNGPGSSAIIINSKFLNNYAGEDGGGIYNNESYTRVINCVFQNNSSGLTGGGVYNVNSSNTLITNCTFYQNSVDVKGGAISNRDSDPELVNCILWNNYAPEYPEIANQESTTKVSFSAVKGGYAGTGNIDSNPLFVDKSLRLTVSSPCIDAGNNQAVPKGVNYDIDANPRIKNGTVDMGAYEFFNSNIEN